MSYLASGTQFTLQQPSNYTPGKFNQGNDNVETWVNSISGATILVGASGNQIGLITTSYVMQNLGVVSGVVYTIGAQSQGFSGSINGGTITPSEFRVIDVNGNAALAPIIVSGATAAVTINGASTVKLSTAYGNIHGFQVSGNTWTTI